MNFIKKGISALLLAGLAISCNDEDKPNPKGLSEIVLSSFSVSAAGDGTIVSVSPISIGATSVVVDFGDPSSSDDVLTIEQGGTATYDYPNEAEEVVYTITVTAESDEGLESKTLTEDVTVIHIPDGAISTLPDSPTGSISNVFAIYSDGMEYDGGLLEYRWGELATGGTIIAVGDQNVLRLSRLGSEAGVLGVATVDPASAFGDGIAATDIHFDVYSDFAEGVDVLKVTLVNEGDTEVYEIDGLSLSDGDWASFDLNLSTDFSAPVGSIDEIHFELGTGGVANEHASIYVDNIYLSKETGPTILNGDFEIQGTYATSQWRFFTYTDGDTNPFGSSSDGSDFDIDGNDTGGKTRGAKWSSSQAGGPLLHSSNSRYAYQALALTPSTDYVVQFQYALDDDNDDPVGLPRHMAGFVLDGHFTDGADALDALDDNLGSHLGYDAEGKFSDTPGDYGTFVEIPFTSNESGEVAVLFYSAAPDDAWIDNVKVLEASGVVAPTADFDADETGELEYTFTNTSLNGASFEWDFGDGNTSTEKSPTHTYASDGDYDVVLTATNSGGSTMANETVAVSPPGVTATFAAVIQNGDFETYPTAEMNDNDLVDAWTIDPDNTFNDGTDTPFDWWRNDDLETWVSDPTNNGGSGTTDKASSSGTDASSDGGSSGRSYKFDSSGERAYQPFEVEDGVEYTISAFIKSESTPIADVEGTFYVLGAEPADETNLGSIALATLPVTAGALDTWQNVSFSFTASSTFSYPQGRVDESVADGGILTSTAQKFVILYFVPTNTVTSDNEVFITDITIETPGF